MREERMAKTIYEVKVEERMPRGRPRKTWEGSVREDFDRRGMNWNRCSQLVQERDKWLYKNYPLHWSNEKLKMRN
ncbi:unnamed protein product [Nezara viridula]|uniref:Uncharacterized protein n=1 Tax=Nezara viridula TaxID=85310 RepID=A0A9P0E4D0_NEZVI|nr:unnamed protein product [Nezara viridula]